MLIIEYQGVADACQHHFRYACLEESANKNNTIVEMLDLHINGKFPRNTCLPYLVVTIHIHACSNNGNADNVFCTTRSLFLSRLVTCGLLSNEDETQ